MSNFPQSYISLVEAEIDIPSLLQLIDFHASKMQDSPDAFRSYCPIHQDNVFRTLVIDKATRTFKCTYARCEGHKGGGLIQLFALSRKVSFDDAVQILTRELHLKSRPPIDPEHVTKNLEVAENYLELDALSEAEKLFQDIADLQPDLVRAREGLLRVYLAQGNAEGELRERQVLGHLTLAQGQYSKALEHAEIVMAVRPDSLDAHRLMAECLLATGDTEAGVWELMAVADMAETSGDYDGALSAYLRVSEIDFGTEIIDVHPHIVRAYTHSGRPEKAINYLLQKAAELAGQGNHVRAAEMYAFALEQDETREDVRVRFLESALNVTDSPDLIGKVHDAIDYLESHGQSEAAAASLHKLHLIHPDDTQTLRRLVDALRKSGKREEAADQQIKLARIFHVNGEVDQAMSVLRSLVELEPEHLTGIELLYQLEVETGRGGDALKLRIQQARAMAAQKEFESAIKIVEGLIQDQEALPALEARAEILEQWARAGRDDLLEKAAIAYEAIGDHLAENNATDESTKYYERASLVCETRPDPLSKLARIYLQEGRKTEARDAVINCCERLGTLQKLDEAILLAEEFVSLIQGDSDLIRYIAELYVRFDDVDTAVARLRMLADSMVAEGNIQEARDTYENALRLKGDDLSTLRAMAEFYRDGIYDALYPKTVARIIEVQEDSEDIRGALATLEAFTAQRPEEYWAVAKMIQLAVNLGDPDLERNLRLQLAHSYREAGNLQREAEVLQEALAREPDNDEILAFLTANELAQGNTGAASENARLLAALQIKTGRPQLARATLERALETMPEDVDLLRDLLYLLCDLELPDAAAVIAIRVIDVLTSAGRNNEAAEIFQRLVACDADNLELKLRQIDFLHETGLYEEAAERRLALAIDYRDRGVPESAETLFNELLAENPENIRAREELIKVYEMENRPEGIAHHLPMLAESFFSAAMPADAVSTMRRYLELRPEDDDARRVLVSYLTSCEGTHGVTEELHAIADYYRRAGNETEAIEVEQEAVRFEPGSKEALLRLVAALLRSERQSEAAEALERAAQFQVEQGRIPDALETLNELLELDPANINARRSRAEVHATLGNQEQALEDFRSLSTLLTTATPASSAAADLPENSTLQIVPEYDFDRFVVGTNNNFAYATALAVARAPAKTYNPLFLYSDVGLGKTHLCNAIAIYMQKRNPRVRVLYTNSEDFTTELVNAIQTNAIAQFRSRYKSVDLLIVDDVQFLAGKQRAQEEFFHIFNALFQAKRQIVVTSDRPPKDIAHLESRLRTRFGAGAIVDIASPDLETRMAILNREVESEGMDIEPPIRMLIAEKIDTNVRELKGALNQVVAIRDIRGQKITPDNVRSLLNEYYISA